MKWVTKFWTTHGERLVFMGMATVFGLAFWFYFPDMKGEAKTILIGIAMLLFNKARGPIDKEPDQENK